MQLSVKCIYHKFGVAAFHLFYKITWGGSDQKQAQLGEEREKKESSSGS
jgi:hypothetical protein